MKLKYLLAAAAATFAATPSLAADISGPRVEAVLGWDNSGVDLDAFGDDDRSDGVLYGLGIGYDFAVSPNFAIGVEGEISDSTTDLDLVDGADRARVSIGRDLYVGARFTGAVSDNVNLYARLGYTNARVRATTTVGGVTVSDAANADGIRGALGAQLAVTDNAYVGMEYRYSNYEADFSRHQIAATLGFRF